MALERRGVVAAQLRPPDVVNLRRKSVHVRIEWKLAVYRDDSMPRQLNDDIGAE